MLPCVSFFRCGRSKRLLFLFFLVYNSTAVLNWFEGRERKGEKGTRWRQKTGNLLLFLKNIILSSRNRERRRESPLHFIARGYLGCIKPAFFPLNSFQRRYIMNRGPLCPTYRRYRSIRTLNFEEICLFISYYFFIGISACT